MQNRRALSSALFLGMKSKLGELIEARGLLGEEAKGAQRCPPYIGEPKILFFESIFKSIFAIRFYRIPHLTPSSLPTFCAYLPNLPMAQKRKWDQASLYNQLSPSIVEGVEQKRFAATTTSTTNTAGVWKILANAVTIDRGTGDDERTGKNISIHSLYAKGFFGTDGNDSETTFRLAIAIDHQCNALPGDSSKLVVQNTTLRTNLTRVNRERFTFIADIFEHIHARTLWNTVTEAPIYLKSTEFWQVKADFNPPIKVVYNNGTAGTAADVQENSIVIIYVADQGNQTFYIKTEIEFTSK